MKILIISDSHSNMDALNEIWKIESDCDYIIFAGDMVDCGFYPRETVHWFMERKDILYAVKGNHDDLILNRKNEPKKQIIETCHDFTLSELGEEEYLFLKSLPETAAFTIGDTDFVVNHTFNNPDNDIYFIEKQLAACNTMFFLNEQFKKDFPNSQTKKRIAIYGHSHLQWSAGAGQDGLIINPGSVSHKFNGEPNGVGDYIVIENGDLKFRHINYETEHLYSKANILKNYEHADLMRRIYKK